MHSLLILDKLILTFLWLVNSIWTIWEHSNCSKSGLGWNGLASWIDCNAFDNFVEHLSSSWQV